MLGGMHNIKSVLHEIFRECFMGSSSTLPPFMLGILDQQNMDNLLGFLTTETPLLHPFCIKFLQKIAKKIDFEDLTEKVLCYKRTLFDAKKQDILPLMTTPESEVSDFVKVVFQMSNTFDFVRYKDFHDRMSVLISLILNLDIILACFSRYDVVHQTVTYLIPSICAEAKCASARKFADKFDDLDIISITIDRIKIVQCEPPLLEKHQTSHHDDSSMSMSYVCK